MPLEPGTRLGPYQIAGPLGQGGMGIVYKARDTRLDRTVAIKVLHESSADLRQRFEREARAVAALQHPHICALYDVGSHAGADYLVMEHLEGAPLEGPLSLPKVIEYGIQIADALDAAHQKGITHRDLKPANIMVTRTGAKVLDFGIARTAGDQTMTQAGAIVGTPAYMAPEQSAGKPADTRSDIYALGCVLHEMATGKRDFKQTLIPARLDWVVKGCVEEDPEQRWQSARDVGRLLESIGTTAQENPAPRRRWLWPAASLLIGIGAVVATWAFKPAAVRVPFVLSIAPPPDTTFLVARNFEGGIALSPDGSMIAFSALTQGRVQLWLRRLDSLQARPLPGTEGAYYPFWSPDSRHIAFFTPGRLMRIGIVGGLPQAICETDPRSSGAWITDDVILLTGRPGGGIHRVPAGGGESKFLLAGNWPHVLPDGKRFLFTPGDGITGGDGIWVASIDSTEEPRKVLDGPALKAAYAAGYLLFARNRRLVAQRFDPATLKLSGEAFTVAESLFSDGGRTEFSVASSGLLAYASGDPVKKLVWRDRAGKPLGEVAEPASYAAPRISPDGKRVAFARLEGNNTDIWIADQDGASIRRLTFDPAVESWPIWSPDGTTITFSSGEGQQFDLFRRAASGAGSAERLTTEPSPQHPMDWSSDGLYLSFTRNSSGYLTDLMVRPASGGATPYTFLQTKVAEGHSQFNPGAPRWIAYSSDESGRREIYVRAFIPNQAASSGRWQVSSGGGTMPRWRGDGRELYYWGLDGRIMAAVVDSSGPAFQSSRPGALFQVRAPTLRTNTIEFDVTRDGQRFLLIEPAAQAESQPLTLVTDWLAAAKR